MDLMEATLQSINMVPDTEQVYEPLRVKEWATLWESAEAGAHAQYQVKYLRPGDGGDEEHVWYIVRLAIGRVADREDIPSWFNDQAAHHDWRFKTLMCFVDDKGHYAWYVCDGKHENGLTYTRVQLKHDDVSYHLGEVVFNQVRADPLLWRGIEILDSTIKTQKTELHVQARSAALSNPNYGVF